MLTAQGFKFEQVEDEFMKGIFSAMSRLGQPTVAKQEKSADDIDSAHVAHYANTAAKRKPAA